MSYIKRWFDDDDDIYVSEKKATVNVAVKDKANPKVNNDSDSEWNDHVKEITSMELDLGWENFYDNDDSTIGVEAFSISDGLIKSLNKLGCVDIEYISSITGGTPYKEIIEKLKGSIFQNPETWGECFFHGWETKEEYVSGNIRKKLIAAKENNEIYNGYFSENIKVLERVLPKAVDVKDIYVTLGSPWLPTWVIRDFLESLALESASDRIMKDGKLDIVKEVRHNPVTGTWEIDYGVGVYWYYRELNMKYGTNYSNRNFMEILKMTMNMQSVAVYDSKESDTTKSGYIKVLNREKTINVKNKQKLLIEKFQSWIWKDEERKRKLYEIYEDKFLSVRTRNFSGDFLEFPTLNPDYKLYSYQKDAVARILFSPNVLLAHDVGAGKTIVMIAAGMEMKRLNESAKVLYVVPNNIVGQWKSMFEQMYPDANLLIVERKNFGKDKREETLRKIRDEQYDGIIMTYTCFTDIPISKAKTKELKEDEKEKLASSLKQRGMSTKASWKQYTLLKDQIYKIEYKSEEDTGICFDELGITRLFVDEAHNFKNVPIKTSFGNILGINSAGSKKCENMMNKVKLVQKYNDGKGVVFATGTPITNSITDAYIMQKYLQSGTMEQLDIQSFDSWVGMFAEPEDNFEVDVDTSTYRVTTRFSSFHNIPELTSLIAQFADFHHMDTCAGVPEHDGYEDVVVKKTPDFSDFLETITQRVEEVRNSIVDRKTDNMLKITMDGRRAALDLRLFDFSYPFTKDSKVWLCAEKVAGIYKDTADLKSAQLVFCDTSVPREGFNLYDELRGLLISLGVAAEDIAYIHDATTEAKREKLFKKVRAGEIRVLIGSTFKLGLGVNVQDKLIALHHLDVPWRPSDMVQREGRILRQGNSNPKVRLYRYITEGSFDAYSWQLLETKQKFISDLLSGMAKERESDDIDNTVLNYAEVKALAIGNELIKERVILSNEITKFRILQDTFVENRIRYEKEIAELPGKIADLKDKIAICKLDADYYNANNKEYSQDERRELRSRIVDCVHCEEPSKEEVLIATYQGFELIAPARVSVHNPVVKLVKYGKYTVNVPVADSKIVFRIDKKLNGLSKDYEELCKRLEEYQNDMVAMKKFLENEHGYAEEIEARQYQIKQIDKELKFDQ